jgi:hypothetical protein
VFPVLRSIDEGIEHWIEAERWERTAGLELERVDYFTFLPDFLPRSLMNLALPLERRLEKGPLRKFSVHYMATLRKPRSGTQRERASQAQSLASTG